MARKNKEEEKEYQIEYYQKHKQTRKTRTSSAVKQRYNKKTYRSYNVSLRVVEDAEVITLIESEKAKGFGTTEAIRNLILKKS